MKKTTKELLIVLIATFVLFFGAITYFASNNSPSQPVTEEPVEHTPPKPVTEIDPELLPLTQALNMQTEGLKIQYVDNLEGTKLAEYISPRTINIKRGIGDVSIGLAHEYLHLVWYQKLSEAERESLNLSLTDLYKNDSELHTRMKNYTDKGVMVGTQDFSTELFSFYCTESSDQWLSQDVLSECNKYISRGALQFKR